MSNTIKSMGDSIKWHAKYGLNTPRKGSPAPDFELFDVLGGKSVRLSSFRGKKPVALIFGSFTWGPFTQQAVRLQDLYSAFRDQVQFLVIYIREAHPVDGWYMGDHTYKDPRTIEERRAMAGTCEVQLKYEITTYVDELDDKVMRAYSAWPDRLFLIGTDGKIAYAGGIGPWGFLPEKLKKAIERLLKKSTGTA